jgi:hypothetical protein
LNTDSKTQGILESKNAYRRNLAKLSPTEKLRILEQLRQRAQIRKGSRRSASLDRAPDNGIPDNNRPPSVSEKKQAAVPTRSHRFGGRATAGGVNYEIRIACFVAVKMLVGDQTSVWEGINGADISAITMQAPEPVDDIVVNLQGDPEANLFISAKERSGTISLTPRSSAFVDTVDAFVRQFLKLTDSARLKSRLVWAVPDCVGRAVTHALSKVLHTYRLAPLEMSLDEFLHSRASGEKRALQSLVSVTTDTWQKLKGKPPAADELQCFLRRIYVESLDFGPGRRLLREIQGEIGNHIVEDPKQARRAWEKVEHFFLQADCHGVPVNRVWLRKTMDTDGIKIKASPDYSKDIDVLRELTARNLSRLREHTLLQFGKEPVDQIRIPRTEELSALVAAVKSTHRLITGEPGCGKSGLIHSLVETLQSEGFPVVLLLAEDNLPLLTWTFDEILANWPNGARGFLVTDALDAVRDVEPQKALRDLLRDVCQGQSDWTVVASVRKFDLTHSRDLRELFPGDGVPGYASDDFHGVAHFYLSRLSEAQLDALAAQRPPIRPFIEGARKSPKAEGFHRSPFHLRLAAELLRIGMNPLQLADWHSPALLLKRFWEVRIRDGAGAGEREDALKAICRGMVDARHMVVSLKQLPLNAASRDAVDELRSRGILVSPTLRQDMEVGADEMRFTHHLLHDYAIARSLIPETALPFCDFAVSDPLLTIFYRQSFLFALEELWNKSDDRKEFWETALKLEGLQQLRGLTRILAPVLAARRVESFADLQPLLTGINSSSDVSSPSFRALQHLASGLQDTSDIIVRVGAGGWCAFVEQLAALLPINSSIEMPLVHILARLNAIGDIVIEPSNKLALNTTGRSLLALHVAKEVSKYRRYFAHVAIETLCRTFGAAPAETEQALLSLLSPERLAQFPHDDLFEAAHSIKHLGAAGDSFVLQLFGAAFTTPGPPPGEYEDTGSAIMSLRFQTSDQWHLVKYALSEYYTTRTGENAAFMTAAACIAWNATERLSMEDRILATIQFRGVTCSLIEDYSHISGRGYKQDENRILTHFETLLNQWAAVGDALKLNTALDAFAISNHTALMWTVFFEAGAKYPSTLGVLLESVLVESVFLTHLDYSYGSTALLGALHKFGDIDRRERLEQLILNLPDNFRLREGESRNPLPERIEYAQNRLLNVLEESNIVLKPVQDLRRTRQAANALPENRKHEGPKASFHAISDEERVTSLGVDLKKPENEEMFRLREALKPFLDLHNKKPVDAKEVERTWPVIEQCEYALEQYAAQQPEMAKELWGHLVGACENIAGHVTSWPQSDARWSTIRRIFLKASNDPLPVADSDDDRKDEGWPSWGWPAPRLDAARGLPFLALRIGHADKDVSEALRRLCRDSSLPLRFNLADRLAALETTAPDLAWELFDIFIANEKYFSVLDALTLSLDRLWGKAPQEVKLRLKLIADRALQSASEENHIHETLAHTHLFYFLRTGDQECWKFIADRIAECDSERASNALAPLLGVCRDGGWLTAGDGVKPDDQADNARSRTWSFFSHLLAVAQTTLKQHRETWERLCKNNQSRTDEAKQTQEKIKRTLLLVDGVAMQLFFASGAFDERSNKDRVALTTLQLTRFWKESAPLFDTLATEPHPHTVHQIVQTLYHLLPCAPSEIFLMATKSIRISVKEARFQYESLAVGDVVKLIQRALADHRDIFRNDAGQESECLKALLEVLDLFVEAGWPEARQLTHRLEEIYR